MNRHTLNTYSTNLFVNLSVCVIKIYRTVYLVLSSPHIPSCNSMYADGGRHKILNIQTKIIEFSKYCLPQFVISNKVEQNKEKSKNWCQ